MQGKALGIGVGAAYSGEFARYVLLERDVTYCGTDLPTFGMNVVASSSLVEIYRLLDASSVSYIRCREYVGVTIQSSGESLN